MLNIEHILFRNIICKLNNFSYRFRNRVLDLESFELLKKGFCYDFTNYEFFSLVDNKCFIKKKDNDIKVSAYYIEATHNYERNPKKSHTFVGIGFNCKSYWIEYAFREYRGIHGYDTENDMLFDVSKKFYDACHIGDGIDIYRYVPERYAMTSDSYILHCRNGKWLGLIDFK